MTLRPASRSLSRCDRLGTSAIIRTYVLVRQVTGAAQEAEILLPPALLDVSTELAPHGRKQLVLEIGLAARAEPLVERRGEDRNGHRLVDGGLDRPPPLARVGNAPFESGKRGILEQRGSGEVEEPRRDHAAPTPHLRDVGQVEVVPVA